MIHNVVNKPSFKAQADLKPATSFNKNILAPTKDTVSFTSCCSDNIVTQKDIDQRVKEFQKIMKGQEIPETVMKVLTNKNIPMISGDVVGKPANSGILKDMVSVLPQTLQVSLAPKITNEISADNITTCAIRLNKVKILDKSEGIFRGNGEVFFISIVNDGIKEPAILKIQTIHDVKNGDDLFDKGLQKPLTLYLSEEGKVPRLLDFRLMVMESDIKESEKMEEILDTISSNSDYKDAVDAIRDLLAAAAPATAIGKMLDSIAGIIKKVLKLNKDDQLLYYTARFTKDFDNLGIGSYDKKYDKVELGYEIVAK